VSRLGTKNGRLQFRPQLDLGRDGLDSLDHAVSWVHLRYAKPIGRSAMEPHQRPFIPQMPSKVPDASAPVVSAAVVAAEATRP